MKDNRLLAAYTGISQASAESINNSTLKKVVYTFIFNEWDWLKPPMKVTPGWRYICFTDEDDPWQPGMPAHTWELHKVKLLESPKRTQGFFKTHGLEIFEGYDTVVSIDGSCHIMGDLNEFTEMYLKRDYALMNHPSRNCTYDEAQVVIQYGKDSEEVVNKQMERYRDEGFPPQSGMVQTGIIARKSQPHLLDFERDWYLEIKKGSQRDQLSWNFTYWYYTKKYKPIEVDYWDQEEIQNEYIAVCPHYRKKQSAS